MVSSSSFLPEFQADKIAPETAPRVVVGAVSPLWLMFGGAAAAGAAYWWWASRWREAVNLEAVLALAPALAPEPVAPALEAEAELEAAPEPVVEAVALAVETAETMLDATEEVAEVVAEAEIAAVESVSEASVEAVEIVTEAVPEVAQPAAEATAAAVDDLTRIVGVGPKLAASLAELGVTRFGQIAAWTPEELATVDLKLNLKGRAERDAWIAQAKRFAAGVEAG